MQKAKVQTDNPQERRCCTLSWLAGFIDSDGCINLYRKYTAKTEVYVPRIVLTNTRKEIVEEIVKAMRACEFPFYIQTRKRTSKKHKTTYDVIVSGAKRCRRVLLDLLPYLRGKKDRGAIMFEFVCSRLDAEKKRKPYTERELTLCRAIKSLNLRGNNESSETICRTANAEEIVRACVRA